MVTAIPAPSKVKKDGESVDETDTTTPTADNGNGNDNDSQMKEVAITAVKELFSSPSLLLQEREKVPPTNTDNHPAEAPLPDLPELPPLIPPLPPLPPLTCADDKSVETTPAATMNDAAPVVLPESNEATLDDDNAIVPDEQVEAVKGTSPSLVATKKVTKIIKIIKTSDRDGTTAKDNINNNNINSNSKNTKDKQSNHKNNEETAKKDERKGGGRPRKERHEYYAIRVGYVVCPTCCCLKNDSSCRHDNVVANADSAGETADKVAAEEDGNVESTPLATLEPAPMIAKRTATATATATTPTGKSPIVSVIRSAIFLRWEDVQQFIEFQKYIHANNADGSAPNVTNLGDGNAAASSSSAAAAAAVNDGTKSKQQVIVPASQALAMEYRVFDSLERAEKYLRIAMPPLSQDKSSARRKETRSSKTKSSSAAAAAASKSSKAKKLSKKELRALKKKNSKSSKKSSRSKAHPDILTRSMKQVNHRPPTKKWSDLHAQAVAYKTANGHLEVSPKETEHRQLYVWLTYQRCQYKLYLDDPLSRKHTLNKEKLERLKEIGFGDEIVPRKRGRPARMSLDDEEEPANKRRRSKKGDSEDGTSVPTEEGKRPPRKKWLEMLGKLQEYKELNGTFDIPSSATEDSELRKWWKSQQLDYRRWKDSGGTEGSISQEKVDMITNLGYVFPLSWNEYYTRLEEYKSVHGTCKVSVEDDAELAGWVKKQKDIVSRHLRGISAKISTDEANKLVAIGLVGTPREDKEYDAKWNEMLDQLRAFKQLNGHCNVPTNSGTELGYWVMAQRRYWNRLSLGKTGKKRIFLDAMKIQRLTQVGFQFCPKGSYIAWEERMKELREFKEDHGHCRVPIGHSGLGDWVSKTRRDYKLWKQGEKSAMSEERERELMDVGFVFEAGKTPERREGRIKSWQERFEDLKRYKDEHGHTVVPQNSGALGQWVHAQRVNYKKIKAGKTSSLTAEKALKLAEIGFVFNASDRSFRGKKLKQQEEEEQVEPVNNNTYYGMY